MADFNLAPCEEVSGKRIFSHKAADLILATRVRMAGAKGLLAIKQRTSSLPPLLGEVPAVRQAEGFCKYIENKNYMNNRDLEKTEYAVELEHVSKIYTLDNRHSEHKSAGKQSFYALKDINLKIEQGDVAGILGTNGSGKSTLSLVVSEISDIDEGHLTVNGEQALIAINTGLNSQLTGLENINVKGALMGFRKKRIQEITQGVIEFAELGDFLYQPVKKYSSGMKSRLGFSISLALNPDIFIIDEALSVGDKGFAQKCLDRMTKLRDEENKTILFISHSLPQVREFCKSGIWIEGGRLVETGDIDTVCDHYAEYVDSLNKMPKKEKQKFLNEKFAERLIENNKKRSGLKNH